uniref:Uncharacterized protein n=1 Tax=Eutreptiella gymnastica TaxID=73025 RepID=A0A7S1IHA4_9EUGL
MRNNEKRSCEMNPTMCPPTPVHMAQLFDQVNSLLFCLHMGAWALPNHNNLCVYRKLNLKANDTVPPKNGANNKRKDGSRSSLLSSPRVSVSVCLPTLIHFAQLLE